MDGNNNTSRPAKPLEGTPDLPRRRTPKLNPDDYAEEMKAFDLDEDQAREFLQIVWDILVMCADVELGFDPVSLICGQNSGKDDPSPIVGPDMLKLTVPQSTTNNEKEDQ